MILKVIIQWCLLMPKVEPELSAIKADGETVCLKFNFHPKFTSSISFIQLPIPRVHFFREQSQILYQRKGIALKHLEILITKSLHKDWSIPFRFVDFQITFEAQTSAGVFESNSGCIFDSSTR
jgi:hypothetical protein